MNLAEAVQAQLPARIAIVGGGGKTSAMLQLARQLPGLVWATTTTHLGTDQLNAADRHVIVRQVSEENTVDWLKQKVTLLTGDFTPDDRVKGPAVEQLDAIYDMAVAKKISLVVEADGSRSRPLKAPGLNEPPIPAWAEIVITVAGLSALGRPFSEATVHRVDPFMQITGMQLGETITLRGIVNLLGHPSGGLKNSPVAAVRIALLNQVDTEKSRQEAEVAVPDLLAAGYSKVVIGSLKFAPERLLCFEK